MFWYISKNFEWITAPCRIRVFYEDSGHQSVLHVEMGVSHEDVYF